MKKLLALSLVLVMVFAMVGCRAPAPPPAAPAAPAPAAPAAPAPAAPAADPVAPAEDPAEDGWVIGIMTGTVSQGEEEYLAARTMQQRFGADRILTMTYPDNFGAEVEVVIANILALVDQGANAIVLVQAVPGTMTAIQTLREQGRDDILFFTGVTHEPPAEIAQHADIAMISDDLSMGRVIIEQAHAMGADTFGHVSFPRHLGMVNINARRELLMQTAEELGMTWVELTAPDPMSEGPEAARMFILENAPRWIAEHGPNVAFFSTNCAMQEPLITQIAAYGGFYPLQCCPSPLHAFPSAFNISMDGNEGDIDFLLEQIRLAVAAEGATGRFSTWPVPINMLLVEIGTLYAIEYLEGRTNGRHDRVVLEQVISRIAVETYGLAPDALKISNWPTDDGYLENFYRLLSDFVTF